VAVALAVILGLVQGIAELFPWSSLGLLVVLPHVLPWPFSVSGARYLPVLTALHWGTTLALLAYFRADWVRLLRAGWRYLGGVPSRDARLLGLIVLAALPVGVVGFFLRRTLDPLFARPLVAGVLLVVNGGILLVANRWRLKSGWRMAEDLAGGDAVLIGVFQTLALLPGLSRSGLVMAGGLLEGLSLEEAARFAFLLAAPVSGAAGLVELPPLLHGPGAGGLAGPALIGGLVAGIAAWFSTQWLLRYFERGNLRGFAWVSVLLGLLSLAVLR
jgi:undecaprenyl-diphosphatase